MFAGPIPEAVGFGGGCGLTGKTEAAAGSTSNSRPARSIKQRIQLGAAQLRPTSEPAVTCVANSWLRKSRRIIRSPDVASESIGATQPEFERCLGSWVQSAARWPGIPRKARAPRRIQKRTTSLAIPGTATLKRISTPKTFRSSTEPTLRLSHARNVIAQSGSSIVTSDRAIVEHRLIDTVRENGASMRWPFATNSFGIIRSDGLNAVCSFRLCRRATS